MHMLHHISFSVVDLERSAAFYDAALRPLGFRRVYSSKNFVGYGIEDGEDKFSITMKSKTVTPPSPGFHLAFSAGNASAVDAFHAAAISHGGMDNGAPGPRPQYGLHYYAAFVIDPDGYHLEAVITDPP